MIIKDGNNFLSFIPVSYEFPEIEFENYDYYDANWINIEFSFLINGVVQKEVFPCLLAQEIHKFIDELDKNKDSNFDIALDTTEPYLILSIKKNKDIIKVNATYYYGDGKEVNKITVEEVKTSEELNNIIEELKEEYSLFPVR